MEFVVALKAEHRLADLLRAAGIARSTFYYHVQRLSRDDPWADAKVAIEAIFLAHRRRYGHRRIHAELVDQGWSIARKTVLGLMRHQGLVCPVRRKKATRPRGGTVSIVAPNLLRRDFSATAPNQKWVTDVTEFAIGERTLYLSSLMDLFDRQIIAYTVGGSPSVALTTSMLEAGLRAARPTSSLLVHSDQGFQYHHPSWRRLLADVGATPSMSRKGNCLDNAVIESHFGTLKEEMFHHETYDSHTAFVTALDEYIVWYNQERRSSTLKGLSPMQY